MRSRGAIFIFITLALVACTTRPLESYPWAVAGERCEAVVVGGGYSRPMLCVEARGVVRAVDGSEILSSYAVEVSFFSDRGRTTIYGHGADFETTMDQRDIRESWIRRWRATVRASEGGPILFQTSTPQPFQPDEPIVIWVERVP